MTQTAFTAVAVLFALTVTIPVITAGPARTRAMGSPPG